MLTSFPWLRKSPFAHCLLTNIQFHKVKAGAGNKASVVGQASPETVKEEVVASASKGKNLGCNEAHTCIYCFVII